MRQRPWRFSWRCLLAGLAASAMVALGGCATPPGLPPSPETPAQGTTAPATTVVDPVAGTNRAAPTSSAASAGSNPATLASSASEPSQPGAPALNERQSARTPDATFAVQTASLRTLSSEQASDTGDRSDLWERVRLGFAMPELESDLVRKWEQWYASRPDYVQRMTERGGRYLFHIVEEVQKRGLPAELALLPFIESAFNPQALSVASASGMWQFMPATGRQFELKQNLFRDDRRDVLASTRAALDYLQMLHQMFGDWQLALAAYNWGQGNVQRALERNRQARLEPVYTALRMPDETRNYLPKLQAVKNIVRTPARFGLSLPPLENHPFFLTVNIERDMDAELVARLAGLSMEEFQALNPQLNKPVLLAAGTPQVLLPYDNANRFVREQAGHRGPWASWTAWVAPRTMRPAEAAKLTGMAEARLRELNRIPQGMLITAGSALIVPRPVDHAQDVTEHLADQARMQLAPETPRMVRRTLKAHPKGESLAAFARRTGHSAADVARWNKLSTQALLKPGQALTVMVASQATTPVSKTTKSNKAVSRPAARKGKPAPRAPNR